MIRIALRATLRLGCLIAPVILVGWSAAQPATADVPSGCEAVHVGPEIPAGSPPSSYFTLRLAADGTDQPALIVANPEPYPCHVEVQPAYGATAINSGDTYPVTGGSSSTCVSTSCWLKGLPAHVTLPAHSRLDLHFTVSVPVGTPPGEYLAGVVAEPGGSRPSLALGHSQAGAILIARVGIGVAITVPGPLHPLMNITSVRLTGTKTGVLSVHVIDQGNTWEHPAGRVIVEIGHGKRVFPLNSATILPGGQATLPLAVSGIQPGEWPTEVELWYDHHRRLTTWLGSVGYADVPTATVARARRPGAHTTYQMPAWSTIVMGALAGLSLALLVVVLLVVPERRRRRRNAIVLRPVPPPGR